MLVNAAPVSGYYGTEVARPVSTGEGVAARSRLLIPPVEQARPVERQDARSAPASNNTATLMQPARLQADTPLPQGQADAQSSKAPVSRGASDDPADKQAVRSAKTPSAGTESEQLADKQLIAQLRSRDREVRVHEAAHAAAGGQYAGSPTLQFQRGPDGVNYVVGGEVSISTSSVSGDPQATLEKARVIRAAALAPAKPSMQDRLVAAKATRLASEARVDLRELEAAEAAEREAQAEAARAKRDVEQGDAPESLKTQDKSKEQPEDVQSKPVEPDQEVAQSKSAEKEDQPAAKEQKDQPNAREELEKILLAGKTLSQQLNEMGLVDPDNPYGKSGFIEMIV
jgi:hypothetical protein